MLFFQHPVCQMLMTSHASLLFATTNHIERLDPALSRPGRMDVWINFTHATKWQAGGLFKCFFPFKEVEPETPEISGTDAPGTEASGTDASQRNLPLPKRKRVHIVPLLSEEEIADLAKKFADQIPEDELSVGCPGPCFSFRLLKVLCRSRVCKVTCSRTRLVRVNALMILLARLSKNAKPERSSKMRRPR